MAPIEYHVVDSCRRYAPSDSVPCIVRWVDSVCTPCITFQRPPSYLNNNHRRLKMALENLKTLGLICFWTPRIRHPLVVQEISHEFPPIPRNTKQKMVLWFSCGNENIWRDERISLDCATHKVIFHVVFVCLHTITYLNFWIDNSQLLAAQQLFHWLHKFEP